MNWDDLRIFLAVARAGQIARAAPLVGMDATTVGRRLRRLEQALGRTLFQAQRDGQHLTEAGDRLLVRAEAMERSMAAIDEREDTGGLIRVSASEGFGTWFLAHHLGGFARLHPGLTIDLVATSGLLSPSKRETDVALLLARPRQGPLVTRKLADYGLRIFAAKHYLEKAPPLATRDDLKRHTLLGYIPGYIFAPELDYLDDIAPGLQPRLRSSSINAQYRMTASGAGIAVLPCFIGDSDPTLVRVLPEIALRRSFWLATHQDAQASPRIRRFVDWVSALAAEHRAGLLGET
ncbi:DNA-binding transcriptional LysR family regulator [Sphingomonas vulcanisoli]|uniref:DNA-binding transcriptional LysR family regulator n=1 Tax=Sphingomonas vulcanisoli TaxID=1658060 RepID=A0ABX0TM00_9SPHN|nr:LysR family transcriptional regulator [Sphingomonas vulcanisoli]NIJ06553.1 DNA-binding transcriptional LysR family regulator [Sphingomonas vulcanisoli]